MPKPSAQTAVLPIEYLDGWVSTQYVADTLGCTRQTVYNMIVRGEIPPQHVRKLRITTDGKPEPERPTLMVRESFVRRLEVTYAVSAEVAEAELAAREEARKAFELRQAVRAWLRDQGRINRSHPVVPQELIDEYLAEQRASQRPRKARKNPES